MGLRREVRRAAGQPRARALLLRRRKKAHGQMAALGELMWAQGALLKKLAVSLALASKEK